MLASTRALLTGILDYAGTFPPASLSLNESVAHYAHVWRSTDRWLLGRLIVPFASLPEFDELASQRLEDRWEVGVVLGARPETQLAQALVFAERRNTKYRVASLEFPPAGASEVRDLSRSVPNTIETFFEVPVETGFERCINVIAASGAFAKVRTGGVTAGAFPSPERLVGFLEACSRAGVAFKATAGLHHPVRGCYPLTYEPGSRSETMHGFLNVSLAAAIVYTGGGSSEAVTALRETTAEMFEFRADGLVWRGRAIAVDDLAASRRLFFRSFGSCSVREPIDDLARLRLL
jgi:hypothetical protein